MSNVKRPAAMLAVLVLALALGACAEMKPLDYTPSGEIPPGPGLFSGKDGEFKVFRK